MTPRLLALGERMPVIAPSAWLAPGATVIGSVSVAAEASIWYGCTLRADTESISIGTQSNIQDGTVIHADPGDPTAIGARVTVGHAAVIHGAKVEDECLIGMRSTILNGARIGAGSIVAAGALVTGGTDVPPGSLVVGTPGKVVRPVSEGERAQIAESWREYVEHASTHRASARPLS